MAQRQNALLANSDILLAVGVVAVLIVMIFPLPPVLMDLLLAMNLALALLILMVSMYMKHPLQFSVFPGLLLIVTLFRLSLNVATTRLILGQAYAGKIILAFGDFVVKGNYVVGLVIFLILVIINFVVITKGAGRVAEVAARFTLDSMPGKQMAIDADLNAGLIDEATARRRREEITREADFYGSMDGASKFVRGDAIAGLIITVLNILGGLIIGMVQHGMPAAEAVTTYTRLTVGDGLVSQIPALIISTTAGLVVTRTATETSMGEDVFGQLLHNRRAVYIAAGVLFAMGITPGLPMVPFFVMGLLTGTVGYFIGEGEGEAEVAEEEEEVSAEPHQEVVEDYLRVDPLELEIGYGLIPLVDTGQGGDLLARITQLRKQCATEIGVVVPPIRIRDNIQLKPNEYLILIRGVEAARGELVMGRYMALNPGTATVDLDGHKVTEPAFGLPAVWITDSQRETAESSGYTVVEPVAVLTTHLLEVLKSNAYQILGRQDTQNLVDNLKKDHPVLVDELIPNQMTLGGVEKVLKNLLRERVSIRNLSTILESLSDWSGVTKDADLLTESVRQNLSDVIIQPYVDATGKVRGITLSAEIEQAIINAVQEHRKTATLPGADVPVSPELMEKLYTGLAAEVEKMIGSGQQPLVITSPGIRIYFRKIIEPIFPNVMVLSYGEIPAKIQVEATGTVR